jgi:alkylation response protein AidB-like acyl-CoA dehydrogenase
MKLRAEFDAMTIRYEDYSLSDEQEALQSAFGAFFERQCPTTVVRAAEQGDPPGFDRGLWDEFAAMGAVAMSVPTDCGGDGAGLVELALVAEAVGRSLAPIPWIDAVVAARLLARLDGTEAQRWLSRVLAANAIVTIALKSFDDVSRQLVPSGAVADAVLALVDDGVCIVTNDGGRACPGNLADAPIAWYERDSEGWSVLDGSSQASNTFDLAELEWRVLVAAAVIGAADVTVKTAVQYAKDRVAFGVPIGAFQAISHPLVDVATAVAAGRNLVRRAAWFADNEPDQAIELILMAFAHASRAATRAATVAIHTHGGLGVTLEHDLQLYFRRVKGWPLVLGDPGKDLDVIGEMIAVEAV